LEKSGLSPGRNSGSGTYKDSGLLSLIPFFAIKVSGFLPPSIRNAHGRFVYANLNGLFY
jgi:hypothetical protein